MKIFGYKLSLVKCTDYPLVWVRYNKRGKIANITKREPKDVENWFVYEVRH